jgi:hypothetical protein
MFKAYILDLPNPAEPETLAQEKRLNANKYYNYAIFLAEGSTDTYFGRRTLTTSTGGISALFAHDCNRVGSSSGPKAGSSSPSTTKPANPVCSL